jgi:hypothetical protein
MLGPWGGLSGKGADDEAELGIAGAAALGLAGPWAGGTGLLRGVEVQAARLPTIASNIRIFVMTLLILEALGALLLLVLIVWWTMFAGRNKGELPEPDQPHANKDPKE